MAALTIQDIECIVLAAIDEERPKIPVGEWFHFRAHGVDAEPHGAEGLS
jgi:hypothetical protein